MPSFTSTDRALLQRCARNLEGEAAALNASYAIPNGWGASAEGREAKREYDRLLRDARDLRALAKRPEAGNIQTQIPTAALEQKQDA